MGDHNIKSLGEAIKAYISAMKWEDKITEASVIADWEKIVGKQIALLTTDLRLKDGILTISLKSSVLRHELQMRKQQLIDKINTTYGTNLVKQIILR